MPKMNIIRKVSVKAKPEDVFEKLKDFHHWTAWSPWLIMENDAKVEVQPDGQFYSWDGKRVGSGEMTFKGAEGNKRIDYDLQFLKPWKSQADISFHIEPNDEGCEISWTMDSSLPFFMFWMKSKMETFVGMDYERGLRMLKEYLEQGKVNSKLEMKGENEFVGCEYVGVKRVCSMEEMGKDMEISMGKLHAWTMEGDVNSAGEPLCIYHEWDIMNKKVTYTAAIPVDKAPTEVPTGFSIGTIPKTRVHTVAHHGNYEHLGNAWGAQQNMMRGKEFKNNKKIDPFEVYKNSPADTAQENLLTEVHFAVK